MTEEHTVSPRPSSLSSPVRQISSEGLAATFDISPDALLLINEAGVIVTVNSLAAECFDYTEQALQGLPLENLLPLRFRHVHRSHTQHYFANPHTRLMGAGLQLFGLRRDGSEFPVDISLRPLLLDGTLHALASVRDITAKLAGERERQAQARQLRLLTDLINLAHDAILLRDNIDRITFWNQGAEALYGWSAQEALGRISHTLLKTRYPQGRAVFDEELEQTGQWEGTMTHTTRTGSTVLVESRQILVRDEKGAMQAILEINRAMTKRPHQQQTPLTTSQDRAQQTTLLQQVLDALPSSLYLVAGEDARLLFANQAASRLWGAHWTPLQPMLSFLEENGIMLLDSQDRPLPQERFATLRVARSGETVFHHQEVIRRPDGSRLPVLVQAVQLSLPQSDWLPVSGPVTLVIHQDVTVLKEAEYIKDEFVGIAAHELRTPLAVLAGYADMLMLQTARGHGTALVPWQQEALTEIKQATSRLTTLTEDLLDVTRLQAGRLVLLSSPLNVVSLVQRVVRELGQTTNRHQITVHTERPTVMVQADSSRLEQILTNLIGNAIKYSPQGGPVQLTIEEDATSAQACLRISDRGIGIPHHQQAQIFGRFLRAENARAWGIHGTGLGLYLCRELAERLGGRLWFESEEGVGSTFFLILPLAPEAGES